MKRFYYTRYESRFGIFDGHRSNTDPMAWCDDVTSAEMVVNSLNKFWEVIHGATPSTTTAATDPA